MNQSFANRKIGVAFSGGAALGMAHLGVLQAFAESGMQIDCVTGTSSGAMVAACVAFGLPLPRMLEKVKQLSWYKLSNFAYSTMGLIKNQAIGKLMIELLGDVMIEQAKLPLVLVAANIQSGERVVFRKGNLAQAVMASTAVPGLFVPVQVEDNLLVDGGLVENLPVSLLKELGADIKIGVDVAHWRTYEPPKNVIDVMLSATEIMTRHQTLMHAQHADVLIQPHLEHYGLGDLKKADLLIAEGYEAARQVLPKIRQLQSRPAGLSWWQKFWGRLSV